MKIPMNIPPRGFTRAGLELLVALGLLISVACASENSLSSEPDSLTVAALNIAYSPEKETMFLKLVEAFNASPSRTEDIPPIQAFKVDMEDMLEQALEGRFGALSPDSSVWIGQMDRLWKERNPGASPLVGSITRYALSPIVIAMWEDTAAEMGYPATPIGWEDLMKRGATDDQFKWSHSSPATASGLLATTAEFYAGAGKSAGLTQQDIQAEKTIEYVKAVEATVGRYGGESEDQVVDRLVLNGRSGLDAFVVQEQSVIRHNFYSERAKLVAVYPKEGTFWMDHPLVLLEGKWVTPQQRRAFRAFAEFVAETDQQQIVLSEGYRPGKLNVSPTQAGSLINAAYGVDPDEPKTLLKVPSTGVLASIREAWKLTKRPANIYLVVDVSGSMDGEKIDGARQALLSFIDQVGGRDRIGLVLFSRSVKETVPLGQDMELLKSQVQAIKAGGGTSLYDAVVFTQNRFQRQSDSDRINAMVVMADGDNNGGGSLGEISSIVARGQTPVLIFTVAYGNDADLGALEEIADLGDGQAYTSDPETIKKLYRRISQFF